MKSRIAHAIPGTNPSKLAKLDALQLVYSAYVQSCLDLMVRDRKTSVPMRERRLYFLPSTALSSQILKNAQRHAVQEIGKWAKSIYARCLSQKITENASLTELQTIELRCCGKYLVQQAGTFGKGTISQEMIDLYQSWLWDVELCGKPPVVGENFPMWFSEMTCGGFGPSRGTRHRGWWISLSTLESRRPVVIPLMSTPYLVDNAKLSRSVLVQKREGRWVFQFTEPESDDLPDKGSAGKIGVDVGLNVIAATSDGRLYGTKFKPKFDKFYKKVQKLRSNRQRQELKHDSKRLHRLERRLTGMVKTIAGEVVNKLEHSFPDYTFIMEDLNLRGCRGQKRFAYRALHTNASPKLVVSDKNSAYTSIPCPRCLYVNKRNRSGVKFKCLGCGYQTHADVVGAINLLGRSEDKQIDLYTQPWEVGALLRERYRHRRDSSSGTLKVNAPATAGPRAYCEGDLLETLA